MEPTDECDSEVSWKGSRQGKVTSEQTVTDHVMIVSPKSHQMFIFLLLFWRKYLSFSTLELCPLTIPSYEIHSENKDKISMNSIHMYILYFINSWIPVLVMVLEAGSTAVAKAKEVCVLMDCIRDGKSKNANKWTEKQER